MAEKSRLAALAVGVAVLITALKVAVGIASGSLGILSESADSALDIVAMAIALLAVRVADRPPDRDHPYGHAKIENLSALVAISLLILTCFGIISEALQRILVRGAAVEANALSFGALGFSMTLDYVLARRLMRGARRHQSQALEASALRFSGDIWNSSITLAGLVLVWLGRQWQMPWLVNGDALAALVLAGVMITAGLSMGRRAVDVLLDAAPVHLAEDIRVRALRVPGVVDAGQVRVRRVGAQIFADMHIAVERAATLEESHDIATKVEGVVRDALPRSDVLVHVDPVAAQGENLMDALRALAARHELQLHGIHVQSIRGELTIQFHVEVPDSLTLEEAHALVSHLEDEARRHIPNVAEVTSHIEPTQAPRASAEVSETGLDAARRTVERIAREACGPDGFHHVMVRRENGQIGILLHVFHDDRSPIREAHDLATRLEYEMRRQIPNVGNVLVHVEPRALAVTP